MVCGKYKRKFSEASHVLFNGHLDDPCFCRVAIQKLKGVGGNTIDCNESGELKIKRKRGRNKGTEFVELTYKGFFGNVTTQGSPFKDTDTPVAPHSSKEQQNG